MRTINLFYHFILAFALLGVVVGCSSSGEGKQQANAPVASDFDYQTYINSLVGDDVPGVVLLVDTPEERFLGAAGYADLDAQTPMETYHRIPNGSAGKAFTAYLVASLVEEKRIDLDAPISTWLEPDMLNQIDYGTAITLRQLLNHTSGVYDYLDDFDFYDAVLQDPESIKTDAHALAFALNKPASAEPGAEFKYSNTGYLLVGLILDAVLGQHHSQEMRRRIFEPLSLDSAFYNALEKNKGDIVSGYTYLDDQRLETSPLLSNIGVADAPVVADVLDLSFFLMSLFVDDAFASPFIRDLMFGESNLIHIGLGEQAGIGMFITPVDGVSVYSHNGREPGYSTQNIYIPDLHVSIAAIFNCGLYDACEQAIEQLTNTVLDQVITN